MRRSGDGDAVKKKKKKKRSGRAASDRGAARPRADGGMRIVVPLQGVVQGRGGLVLGSLIPCAPFYFFQLYIKRNRSSPSPPGSPTTAAAAVSSIHRSLSRGLVAPRAALPAISARGASVRDDGSLYYAGLHRCADPYHPATNPSGISQLGLVENYLSLDLVGRWMEEHAAEAASMAGGEDEDERELSIRGFTAGQRGRERDGRERGRWKEESERED